MKAAVAGVVVWYRSDEREFPKTVTGDNGKAVMDRSVGRPSGGFTLIQVTATHQAKMARTSQDSIPAEAPQHQPLPQPDNGQAARSALIFPIASNTFDRYIE